MKIEQLELLKEIDDKTIINNLISKNLSNNELEKRINEYKRLLDNGFDNIQSQFLIEEMEHNSFYSYIMNSFNYNSCDYRYIKLALVSHPFDVNVLNFIINNKNRDYRLLINIVNMSNKNVKNIFDFYEVVKDRNDEDIIKLSNWFKSEYGYQVLVDFVSKLKDKEPNRIMELGSLIKYAYYNSQLIDVIVAYYDEDISVIKSLIQFVMKEKINIDDDIFNIIRYGSKVLDFDGLSDLLTKVKTIKDEKIINSIISDLMDGNISERMSYLDKITSEELVDIYLIEKERRYLEFIFQNINYIKLLYPLIMKYSESYGLDSIKAMFELYKKYERKYNDDIFNIVLNSETNNIEIIETAIIEYLDSKNKKATASILTCENRSLEERLKLLDFFKKSNCNFAFLESVLLSTVVLSMTYEMQLNEVKRFLNQEVLTIETLVNRGINMNDLKEVLEKNKITEFNSKTKVYMIR